MSSAARSAAVFSAYLFVLGLFMIAGPDTFTELGQLPTGPDFYMRILAVLVLALAGYFGFAARDDNRAFLAASVRVRLGVFIAFVVVALTAGEPMLILFGAIDAAFAGWTWVALRSNPG